MYIDLHCKYIVNLCKNNVFR